MGNTSITNECCSDRKEKEFKMASRFERPEFYNKQLNPSHSTPSLENSMLDPLRKTYEKNFLTEVGNTLNERKIKEAKSIKSDVSLLKNKRKLLSERSACGSSTFGDYDKMKMIRVGKSLSLMKHLRQDDYSNADVFFYLFKKIKNMY